MMTNLQVRDLAYFHADRDILFQHLSFSVPLKSKCAIVGNNGVGKSTLLRILAGDLEPASGEVVCEDSYLVPQHLGQFDGMTVAEALGIADKLRALAAISEGDVSERHFTVLKDDWTIEARLSEAFAVWGIEGIPADARMGDLSGGEKTKVFLAGMDIRQPAVVLLDEPTNHLDAESRDRLYRYIDRANRTLLVVSHDRVLLNSLPAMLEMTQSGMRFYPVPYDAYRELRDAELQAGRTLLENRKKELSKARRSAQEAIERQQKRSSRGEKHSQGKCVARIAMGNLRDRSEASTAQLDKVLHRKIEAMDKALDDIRSSFPADMAMKVDFDASSLHAGKLLLQARQVNYAYPRHGLLWTTGLDFSVYSGDRIRLQGGNGKGKSTCLRLLMGLLPPTCGEIYRAPQVNIAYLDQEYSCLDASLSVFEQLASCNTGMQEHELKICLNRFLFPFATWHKKCGCLSGGEKMKLALCGLMVAGKSPDIIIADEPANNLDIQSMEILSSTFKQYEGTIILVTHDEYFIQEIGINKTIVL